MEVTKGRLNFGDMKLKDLHAVKQNDDFLRRGIMDKSAKVEGNMWQE